jgi:hypothetical protein
MRIEPGSRVLDPVILLLLTLIALFAPWWGTPIGVALSYLTFQISAKRLILFSFLAWVIACVARDFIGGWGASRVIAKMLALENLGLPAGSFFARSAVYLIVGLLGFVLALFSVGAVKAARELTQKPA